MRKTLLFGALAAFVFGLAGLAWAQNSACNVLNCKEQGGSRWSVAGSLDILSGGDLDIESGGALKLGGTTVSSSAAELDDTTLQIVLVDVSSNATHFVVSHFAGSITDWYCVLEGAITTANNTLTLNVNGSPPTTGSTITVAFSGSAAGDIDSDLTVATNNAITAGQAVSIGSSGDSTNTVREICTVVVNR